MLPGPVTCRNLSRYSPYHEKTFARWYATDFDCLSQQSGDHRGGPP
jgi:hypothetical protein